LIALTNKSGSVSDRPAPLARWCLAGRQSVPGVAAAIPRASIAPAAANSEKIGQGPRGAHGLGRRVKAAPAELRSEFERRDNGKLPADWKKAITGAYAEFIASRKEMATRSASGAVLDYLAAAPAAGGRRMFRKTIMPSPTRAQGHSIASRSRRTLAADTDRTLRFTRRYGFTWNGALA